MSETPPIRMIVVVTQGDETLYLARKQLTSQIEIPFVLRAMADRVAEEQEAHKA